MVPPVPWCLNSWPQSLRCLSSPVSNTQAIFVICGHSDCKAVNMLYDIHTDPLIYPPNPVRPPSAPGWLLTATEIYRRVFRLEAAQFRKPLLLNKAQQTAKFPAMSMWMRVQCNGQIVHDQHSPPDGECGRAINHEIAQGRENPLSRLLVRHLHRRHSHFSRKENFVVASMRKTLPTLEEELHEIIAQTQISDDRKQAAWIHWMKNTTTYQSLIQEARRNFSTSSCAHRPLWSPRAPTKFGNKVI